MPENFITANAFFVFGLRKQQGIYFMTIKKGSTKAPKPRSGKGGTFTKLNSEEEWLYIFKYVALSKEPDIFLKRYGKLSLGSKFSKYERDISSAFRSEMITALHVPSQLLPNGEKTLQSAACGVFRRLKTFGPLIHNLMRTTNNLFESAKSGIFAGDTFDIPLVYGLCRLGYVKTDDEELDRFWFAIRRYAEILNGVEGRRGSDKARLICYAYDTSLPLSTDTLDEIHNFLIDVGLIYANSKHTRLAAVKNVETMNILDRYIHADGFRDTLIIGGPGTGKSWSEINRGRVKGVISLANKIAADIGEHAHCPFASFSKWVFCEGTITRSTPPVYPTHVDEIGTFSLCEWSELLRLRSRDLLGGSCLAPLTLMGDDLQQVSFTSRGLILHSIIAELGLTYPRNPCNRIHEDLPQSSDLQALYGRLMDARLANSPSMMAQAFSVPCKGIYSVSLDHVMDSEKKIESGEVLVLGVSNKDCDSLTKAILDRKGVRCKYDDTLCSLEWYSAPEGTTVLVECTENDSAEGVYNRMRALATSTGEGWVIGDGLGCQRLDYFRPRYATTVFSSQGLSADHVVILPVSHPVGIEVLFTAATRHRKSLSFVGGKVPQTTPAVDINNFDELRKVRNWLKPIASEPDNV